MKIIVDTSAWIEFFRPNGDQKCRTVVRTLVEQQQAVLTDVIVTELLVGARGNSEFIKLKRILTAFDILSLVDSAQQGLLNEFGFKLKKMGLFAKYTDLTIAFLAHHHGFKVYSLDQYFKKLSDKNVIETI